MTVTNSEKTYKQHKICTPYTQTELQSSSMVHFTEAVLYMPSLTLNP